MIYIIIYYAGAGSTKNRKTKNSITRKGNTSTFTYDAAGKKLAHFDGKLVKTTNYCSNFVYENGSLAYIISLEGRILRNTNGSYTYEYFLKDHLGNTRVTFQDNGTVVQTADYYPFGMRHEPVWQTESGQNYLYNGKELQEDLDWYDYGFRFYDPALGRFPSLDPKADEFNWVSPYNYAENRPIDGIDLWGLQWAPAPYKVSNSINAVKQIKANPESQKLGSKMFIMTGKYGGLIAGTGFALITGNTVALINLPAAIGITVAKDAKPESDFINKASSSGVVGNFGLALDEIKEKITGKESDIFQASGEVIDAGNPKDLVSKPKDVIEKVERVEQVVKTIKETIDVEKVVTENKNDDENKNKK